MKTFQEIRRRSILPLACLALVGYYFFVFLPLGRRAASEDRPLNRAWHNLALSLDQSNAMAIDFLHITNQLRETKQAFTILEAARQKAVARLELSSPLRAKMNGAFQLVDFNDERSRQMEDLTRQGKAAGITLEPPVFSGFPEYAADVQQPSLLWAALSMVTDLLNTALQCKVTAIHSLEVPLTLTSAPAPSEGLRLAEIPLQIELTGSADSVTRLLQLLPLRGDELKAAGLAQPADKTALFIDRLMLKKQSPEKPDELRLWLRAVGFVLRE